MKKCPICGTVSSEMDAVCGVCGTNLAQVQVKSETAPPTQSSRERRFSLAKTRRADRRTQGILGLLVGIVVVATGILLIELIALVGILMLLFGFTVIATDISWMRGNTFYDQDEPILHGRAPLHGRAVFGTGIREEPSPGSSSQRRDEKEE